MKIFLLFGLLSFGVCAQSVFFKSCMDKFPMAGDYLKTHQLTKLCTACGNEQSFNEPFLCISRRQRERGENDAVAAQKCAEKLRTNPSCQGLSRY